MKWLDDVAAYIDTLDHFSNITEHVRLPAARGAVTENKGKIS